MNLLSRILLITTWLLTIYLVRGLEQQRALINILHDNLQQLAPLQAQLAKQETLLLATQSELVALHKEINERVLKAEKRQNTLRLLQQTLVNLDTADNARKANNLAQASTLLLATKEPLWQAGDIFTTEQSALRGLMTAIDAALTAWKNGNAAFDVSKITTGLKTVLNRLSREPQV